MSNIVRENKRKHVQQQIQTLIQKIEQNYTIKSIAQGFQGEVFLVEEMQNICKIMNYNYYQIEDLLPLFQNEILQLTALDSTSIIPPLFHDLIDHVNHYYFSQALMNQGDLWQLIECNQWQLIECNLSTQCLLGLSSELLRLVNYLHSLGFYHFDIKQQNFLLHQDYQIRLLKKENNKVVQREIGLQQLIQILSRNQNIQFQSVPPNYNELQRILKRNDGNNIEKFSFQNQEEIFQLIYWIKKYLEQNQIQNFDPYQIRVEFKLRMVFCDFGFAQYNALPLCPVGTPSYKSPFMILYPQVLDQTLIPKIARQCDLFSLGMTIFKFLMSNKIIELKYCQFNVMEQQNIIAVVQSIQQLISGENSNNFKNLQIMIDNKQYQELIFCCSVKEAIKNKIEQTLHTNKQDILFPLYRLLDQLITFNFLPTPNLIQINYPFDDQVQNELLYKIQLHRQRQKIIQQRN